MSYILDALKKTEREKARKERKSGASDLSDDLFNDGPSHNGSSLNVVKISVVIVLASLVTFGVTWYLLRGDKGPKVPSQPVVSVQPSPTQPPLKTPVIPSPAPAVKTTPLPTTFPPASVVTGFQPAQDVVPSGATVSQERDDDEGRVRRRPKTAATAPTAPPTQIQKQNDAQNPNVSVPGDIKVSGIAWQDERRARRAVVNGFLLHEGSIVSGAKITEILQDRVRFSQGGRIFDVSLISASMPLNK